jgi:hypothetical protein
MTPAPPEQGMLRSPCVGICRLDDTTGWCLGCARDANELASRGERISCGRYREAAPRGGNHLRARISVVLSGQILKPSALSVSRVFASSRRAQKRCTAGRVSRAFGTIKS